MPDRPYTVPGTSETRYRHITTSQQRLMADENWKRTVARHRMVKNWLQIHRDEFETATELAEAAANEFNLYTNQVTYDIPEWVFEQAAVIKPTT